MILHGGMGHEALRWVGSSIMAWGGIHLERIGLNPSNTLVVLCRPFRDMIGGRCVIPLGSPGASAMEKGTIPIAAAPDSLGAPIDGG